MAGPKKKISDEMRWALMRQIVVSLTLCIVLALFLAFNYNRWDVRDWQTMFGTILAAIAALFGVDTLKGKISGRSDTKDNDSDSAGEQP